MSKDDDLLRCLSAAPINDISLLAAIELVKGGANPNLNNRSGKNLLHLAVEFGNPTYIQAALDIGVDANMPNSQGHTPLYFVMNQQPCPFDIAFILLNAKASPHTTTSRGETLLHLAAKSQDLANIRGALVHGINPRQENTEGYIALSYAFAHRKVNTEAVALLVLGGMLGMHSTNKLHNYPNRSLPALEAPPAASSSSEPGYFLNRKQLKHFAKFKFNKQRTLEYIAGLPDRVQEAIIDQCQTKETPLYQFFNFPRGITKTLPTTGSNKVLMEMKQALARKPTRGHRSLSIPTASMPIPIPPPTVQTAEIASNYHAYPSAFFASYPPSAMPAPSAQLPAPPPSQNPFMHYPG